MKKESKVSMFLLIIQNVMLLLFMRYSRKKDGPPYIITTLVCCVESFKLVISIIMQLKIKGLKKGFSSILKHIIYDKKTTLCMLIPAFLYSIQNNMLLIAISNLDTVTYQITYQIKFLTTAMFSVLILKRQMHRLQWISLLLLVIGVSIIQIHNYNDKIGNENSLLGFLMVLCSSFTSGFAGVYFEKIVKKKCDVKVSIWIRSIQLEIWAIIFSVMIMLMNDFDKLNDPFIGYDFTVYAVIFFQVIGGILVSLVIMYADNVIKGFASAISILLNSLISFGYKKEVPSPLLILGCFLVLTSILLFNFKNTK